MFDFRCMFTHVLIEIFLNKDFFWNLLVSLKISSPLRSHPTASLKLVIGFIQLISPLSPWRLSTNKRIWAPNLPLWVIECRVQSPLIHTLHNNVRACNRLSGDFFTRPRTLLNSSVTKNTNILQRIGWTPSFTLYSYILKAAAFSNFAH